MVQFSQGLTNSVRIWPTQSATLGGGGVTPPPLFGAIPALFITKEVDVVVLQKVLGLKHFHARYFVMQKGNLSDVQNILRVLKKGNDVLRQDLLPKIIPISTLSQRLYHPHHQPRNEEDKNTNTFRTFDQFTMTLFIWNLIRSRWPDSVILKIGSPRDINEKFIAHCQYSVEFYKALESHAKPSSLVFDKAIK